MNRADNIFEFRRALFHGQKTGPNADPDYHEKYHPGAGGSSEKKTGFGLSDGKHRIKTEAVGDLDAAMGNGGPEPQWVDVYVNPTKNQMKRLSDPDATWPIEMRFMVHRKTGDLVAWEADKAFHTQVTWNLMGIPAWAAQGRIVDLYSDFTIPAEHFYEGLEQLIVEGHSDEILYEQVTDLNADLVVPKILRRKK